MLIYGSMELSDEDSITALYEAHLNAGDSVRDYIRKGLEDKNFIGVKCVDYEDGKIVGILAARPGIGFTYPHPELEMRIQSRWGTEGGYTADMLVVEPAYRGAGIADKMMRCLRESLREKHAVYMVLEAWIRAQEHDIPALGSFRHLGEGEVVVVDHAFYKDLKQYHMTCPECGEDCRCGAVVSVIDLRYLWDGRDECVETS